MTAVMVCCIFSAFSLAVSATTSSTIETQEGTNTYALFNSGQTSSSGNSYREIWDGDYNPDAHSYNNNGYDIHGGRSNGEAILTIGMGCSFHVNAEVTERSTLTIYAFDIDEEYSENDKVYLVNAQTGARTYVGTLSGRDWSWSTTTITIEPSLFEVGQTYYFEFDIYEDGWETWIRTVSLQMTCGEYVPTTILDHSFTASIDSLGYVSTELYMVTDVDTTYNLEYTATINNQQKGGKDGTSITATTYGSAVIDAFQLESGSPTGTYEICVIVKDLSGNTVVTYTVTAGYNYSAVSYDPNGGSNNLPLDSNSYSSGETVTVLFNNIPSRQGYTFLGWSTDPNATLPEFTVSGNNTFVIGNTDVTLYAVWAENQTNSPKFIVDSATARPGEEFTIAVRTENNPGIVSFKFKVHYDADVLELVSAEEQSFTNLSYSPITNNPFIVNWVDAITPNNTTNGTVVLLTFRVKDDAQIGDSSISLTYDPYDIYNDTWDGVYFSTVSGTVTVVDYTLGDVNDDGVINNRDLGLLQQYLNGWSVTIVELAADVNVDGVINNRDLGLMQQYLNGWNVQFG